MADGQDIRRRAAMTPAELVLVSALTAHCLTVVRDRDWDAFQRQNMADALEWIEPRDDVMRRLTQAARLVLNSEAGSAFRSGANWDAQNALAAFYKQRLRLAVDKFEQQIGEGDQT